MTAKSQYPTDYNPPNRGKCEKCGYETRGWSERYLSLCPRHWQELLKKNRSAAEKSS
jgi:hypothetical protein